MHPQDPDGRLARLLQPWLCRAACPRPRHLLHHLWHVHGLRPFIKPKDDTLAQVAQIAIFFALLAGLMIMTDADSPAIDVILMLMLTVPPTLALIFNTPLLDQVKTLYS